MYWKASFVERITRRGFSNGNIYIYIYIFEQLVSRSFSSSRALNFDTVCHSVPRYPSIPVVCYSDASNYASLMPLTFDERAGEVSSPHKLLSRVHATLSAVFASKYRRNESESSQLILFRCARIGLETREMVRCKGEDKATKGEGGIFHEEGGNNSGRFIVV